MLKYNWQEEQQSLILIKSYSSLCAKTGEKFLHLLPTNLATATEKLCLFISSLNGELNDLLLISFFKWWKKHNHLQMFLPRTCPTQKLQPSLVPGDPGFLLWWGFVGMTFSIAVFIICKAEHLSQLCRHRDRYMALAKQKHTPMCPLPFLSCQKQEMNNTETCTALYTLQAREHSWVTLSAYHPCLIPGPPYPCHRPVTNRFFSQLSSNLEFI